MSFVYVAIANKRAPASFSRNGTMPAAAMLQLQVCEYERSLLKLRGHIPYDNANEHLYGLRFPVQLRGGEPPLLQRVDCKL